MSAILKLAEEVKAFTVEADKKSRYNRREMLNDELVNFRPTYEEAAELVKSLQTGLASREGPYGDDLPIEAEHAFQDLIKALDAATPYEPDAYESMNDHDDIEYRKD